MSCQRNYETIFILKANEDCSNRSIALVLLQPKMLQQVEVRRPAQSANRLSYAAPITALRQPVMTLKL